MASFEQGVDFPISNQKIYNTKEIRVGTFIGGPLVAGYLVAENYKAFNEPDKAKKAWIYAILFTIVLFGAIFLIPGIDKTPEVLLPLIYTWSISYIVELYQGAKMTTYINSGGELFSWWRLIGVSLIGCVITVALLFGAIYISETITDTTIYKTYGTIENKIGFDKTNISTTEVDKIADAFTQIKFFNDKYKKYVYVKKVNSSYEISISCDKAQSTDPNVIAALTELRNYAQKDILNNKIVFNIVVDSMDNLVKRIE